MLFEKSDFYIQVYNSKAQLYLHKKSVIPKKVSLESCHFWFKIILQTQNTEATAFFFLQRHQEFTSQNQHGLGAEVSFKKSNCIIK